MKFCATLLMALSLAAPIVPGAFAADVATLSDPVKEARARNLQKQLRCLICQGQSIDESEAPLAADLRQLVREHIAMGESDQQIKDYLVARYGDFILMQPPVRNDTLLLWFGPALLILFGGAVVGITVSRARSRAKLGAGQSPGT